MTAVLLDFFGTLVEYSPSRTDQGYAHTHGLLERWGSPLTYSQFLDRWTAVAAGFDAASDVDDHEFSMDELCEAFLATEPTEPPESWQVDELVASYLGEWSTGIRPIDGVAELVGGLAGGHRLAVVTNTHHPRLVPDLLDAMGLASAFEAVVTSVEVGWRKPHPAIYRAALEALAVEEVDAVFVGDTLGPDYDGPRSIGIRALLIDGRREHAIAPEDRLDTILELPERLGSG